MIGVGKMKQYSNVLDRPLSKGKQEVSLSAFAFLFSELVQYNQTQVDNIAELERRLEDAGYAVGARVLELLCHREKGNRRETRLLGILSFIHSTVWKVLFGKVADSLEKGTEHEDEYMISEKELLVNRFISIPKDMGAFNCGAFVAGIVRGVLDNSGFPAVVTAHFVPVDGQHRPRTTILIKFAEELSPWDGNGSLLDPGTPSLGGVCEIIGFRFGLRVQPLTRNGLRLRFGATKRSKIRLMPTCDFQNLHHNGEQRY
ncbi:hypothetical protein BUALT_Bualt16G0085700 [Buddleja alternifolia]|uniref:Trafficking protein particle complex subunit n=1 Tax=Buddleja alternifolia TaxID=168488 RepID=A0AAV6W7Z8_9LAMI|nr:hypothetical protein BUALT_Bualt16G0085700 [Buddleja alternifolia]